MNKEIEENIAEEIHKIWIEWSRSVMKELEDGNIEENVDEIHHRWFDYWKPYSELPEKVKKMDREQASKIIEIIEEKDEEYEVKEEVKERLPIIVDLPLGWTLKWDFGINDSIVKRVYREKGKLVDEDIISCLPIPEAVPTEEEIKIQKQIIIDEYNLDERELSEDSEVEEL